MLKRIGLVLAAVLFFSVAAHAQREPIETTMIETPSDLVLDEKPTELVQALQLVREIKAELAPLRVVPQVTGCTGHCVGLFWTLSIDDDAGSATPVNCTTAAACSQSVFRATGSCTSSTTFGSPIATLAATAAAFTDSNVKVGQSYCYAVSFSLNSLSSGLSNSVAAVILPAAQTGLGEKSQ